MAKKEKRSSDKMQPSAAKLRQQIDAQLRSLSLSELLELSRGMMDKASGTMKTSATFSNKSVQKVWDEAALVYGPKGASALMRRINTLVVDKNVEAHKQITPEIADFYNREFVMKRPEAGRVLLKPTLQ